MFYSLIYSTVPTLNEHLSLSEQFLWIQLRPTKIYIKNFSLKFIYTNLNSNMILNYQKIKI